MRQVLALCAMSAMSAMSGCGAASSPLAGTWVSTQSAIQHVETARSIFATSQLTVSPMGELSGSFRTISPTSVVGENGTITGAVTLDGSAYGNVNMTITYPTLGTFKVNGTAVYSAATAVFGVSNATTRDAMNNVVGTTSIAYQRQ